MFVAPADDLKEEVGAPAIVGQVADFVDGEERGAGVVAEAAFEGSGHFLPIEIKEQVGGGRKQGGVAG